MCATNAIPLARSLFLPVDAVNSVQTLKADIAFIIPPMLQQQMDDANNEEEMEAAINAHFDAEEDVHNAAAPMMVLNNFGLTDAMGVSTVFTMDSAVLGLVRMVSGCVHVFTMDSAVLGLVRRVAVGACAFWTK
jgi:hypothetical protein